MPRTSGPPVTDADRNRIRELHAQGLSRNEIARQTGRSGRTVSRIADALGLTFERERTREATEARKADARAKRAALAVALLDDAERLRQQLWQPALVYNFGGKDNTFEQATVPEPSYRDKRDIMTAIGMAVDRSVRLDEYDSGTGLDQVVSLLDALGTGLARRYGTGDAEHPTDPAPADA